MDAESIRTAYYTNISPGNYVFRVRACNNDGIWNETGASFAFYIQPHFYQTIWFYILCAVSLILIGWRIHRFRVSRLLELERIRTRIATDLHDDIGSGLSHIAILSEVAERYIREKNPQVTEALVKISDTSRELIDSMSDLVWSMNPARDRAGDLIQRMHRFANDVLPPRNIHLQFEHQVSDPDRVLAPDVRRHIYLIFKESTHNIIRHSGCDQVKINVQIEKSRMNLTINDNGKGFDPELTADGHGVRNMTQRARQLGGLLQFLSGPEGTTVRLSLPL
ncbi:histidine kinase [bacterium]|nr:histidine kinase [bacterium]